MCNDKVSYLILSIYKNQMYGDLTTQKYHQFFKMWTTLTVQKYRRRIHQDIRQLNNEQHAMQASSYNTVETSARTTRGFLPGGLRYQTCASLHFSDKGLNRFRPPHSWLISLCQEQSFL